ncbi:MAG: Segregation and condensation protein A [Candidatus Woesearchaeota archaeon]|nr:Segregation and condensation protein A [Candidatus Woesearchaeota archaeon]
MQQKIFSLLLENDEITWKSIIQKLVKEEQMDPWDVDVSVLSKKYIQMLNKLKELDFRISGKIVLAAALLLKMKSSRLVGEDMTELDRLIASADQYAEDYSDEFYGDLEREFMDLHPPQEPEIPKLVPKTPQPRTRKVSVYDLMEALEQALQVKKRRIIRNIPAKKIEIPEKEIDITQIIKEVYVKVKKFFRTGAKELFFTDLIKSDAKEDVILTFIPLLHLAKQRKIDLQQDKHFGPIEVQIKEK